MATRKSQRIGIIVILAALVIGTIWSFVYMIVASQEQSAQSAQQQKELADYQAKTKKQTDELSAKYYPVLNEFSSRVGAFDRDSVTAVSSEDLKEGDGAVIGDKTQYSAYYIGWNPSGQIFDQSIDGGKLKSSIPGQGLIPGWTEGVKGMKLGGVREITIPSDKAYGEKGSGDKISPNTPIRFIVLAIPTPAEIPMPSSLMQGGGY